MRARVLAWAGSMRNQLSSGSMLVPGLSILAVGTLIFFEFLFGNALLLYKDVGSDSLNSYYPDFVNLSRYVRAHGFPSWSFHVGMGQDLCYATGYLVWQPVSWLPQSWIAGALVYQHLGKVLLAGLIFFRLLQLLGLRSLASLLGSLLLAFSAFMCMGSCWYPLADEVVCFAAIMLGVEKILRGQSWITLLLGIALVGMITPFHLYLAAILVLAYGSARLFARSPQSTNRILRASLAIGLVAVLAVGLGAVITLPYLYAVLNSPRGSGTTSLVGALSSKSLFSFESPLHYFTALLRPFANDMLGAGGEYRGSPNYLEAPIPYCGLLCLVILPQVFVRRASHPDTASVVPVSFLAFSG
jgi:hypothetical protein